MVPASCTAVAHQPMRRAFAENTRNGDGSVIHRSPTPTRCVRGLSELEKAGRGEEDGPDEERDRVDPFADGIRVERDGADREARRPDHEQRADPPVAGGAAGTANVPDASRRVAVRPHGARTPFGDRAPSIRASGRRGAGSARGVRKGPTRRRSTTCHAAGGVSPSDAMSPASSADVVFIPAAVARRGGARRSRPVSCARSARSCSASRTRAHRRPVGLPAGGGGAVPHAPGSQ